MNLIERIYEAMTNEDDNLDRQSERLIEHYKDADAAGKKLLNDAFACLCGYRLATLLKQTETQE